MTTTHDRPTQSLPERHKGRKEQLSGPHIDEVLLPFAEVPASLRDAVQASDALAKRLAKEAQGYGIDPKEIEAFLQTMEETKKAIQDLAGETAKQLETLRGTEQAARELISEGIIQEGDIAGQGDSSEDISKFLESLHKAIQSLDIITEKGKERKRVVEKEHKEMSVFANDLKKSGLAPEEIAEAVEQAFPQALESIAGKSELTDEDAERLSAHFKESPSLLEKRTKLASVKSNLTETAALSADQKLDTESVNERTAWIHRAHIGELFANENMEASLQQLASQGLEREEVVKAIADHIRDRAFSLNDLDNRTLSRLPEDLISEIVRGMDDEAFQRVMENPPDLNDFSYLYVSKPFQQRANEWLKSANASERIIRDRWPSLLDSLQKEWGTVQYAQKKYEEKEAVVRQMIMNTLNDVRRNAFGAESWRKPLDFTDQFEKEITRLTKFLLQNTKIVLERRVLWREAVRGAKKKGLFSPTMEVDYTRLKSAGYVTADSHDKGTYTKKHFEQERDSVEEDITPALSEVLKELTEAVQRLDLVTRRAFTQTEIKSLPEVRNSLRHKIDNQDYLIPTDSSGKREDPENILISHRMMSREDTTFGPSFDATMSNGYADIRTEVVENIVRAKEILDPLKTEAEKAIGAILEYIEEQKKGGLLIGKEHETVFHSLQRARTVLEKLPTDLDNLINEIDKTLQRALTTT